MQSSIGASDTVDNDTRVDLGLVTITKSDKSDDLTAPEPKITGDPIVGSTLTADARTWGPAPVELAYQWNADGEAIPGATSETFALTMGQLGQAITVTVTGTKDGSTTTSKTSSATDEVTAPEQPVEPVEPVDPEQPVTPITFTDVVEGSWYFAPVNWMVQEGITTGYKDGTFRSDKNMTRAEIAAFLDRYNKILTG